MSLSRSVLLSSALCLAGYSHAAAMQAAYIKNDGWVPSYISQFNTDVGKPLAIVNLFTSFDYNWPNQLRYQSSNIVALGAMPMITLMPVTSTRKTANLLPEILSGQWNSYIDSWISGLKTWQATYSSSNRPTVLIRFAHEFNGNWYPWGNDPTNLKAAWRYLRARFDAAGVTNVEWVWCANNGSVDSYNNITVYYPGDDVVDWTGLDGYNWGSNYSFSRWKTFNETFSTPYIQLVTNMPNKPVMLGEVASVEPSDIPNPAYGQNGTNADANESKEVWVQDMYSRIMTDYPAIRAIAWFNYNKEFSWGLNGIAANGQPNTGLTAYRAAMANSFYRGTFTPLNSPLAYMPPNGTLNLFIGQMPMIDYQKGDFVVSPHQDSSDYIKAAYNDALINLSLPKNARYQVLPIPEGQDILQAEAEGFRRLSEKARQALLDAKLNLIEPTP